MFGVTLAYNFDKMKFKTSVDKLAKVVTAAITILFASVILAQLVLLADSLNNTSIMTIFVMVAIYLIVFLFRPISYEITDSMVLINRPLSDIIIQIKEIKSVEILEVSRLSGAVRLFGVGGLFGYWGKFYNRKIGTMTWYATRRDQAILITTKENKKIVLTPDEPEIFVSTCSL